MQIKTQKNKKKNNLKKVWWFQKFSYFTDRLHPGDQIYPGKKNKNN